MPLYHLNTSLQFVKGVGPILAGRFAQDNLLTVRDLLLFTPYRYEDRSQISTVAEVLSTHPTSDPTTKKAIVTLRGTLTGARSSYRGRRSFQSATFHDATGKLKVMWFNNPHVIGNIKPGTEYFVSGTFSDRGSLTQPTIEPVRAETLHTNRFVPMYSSSISIGPTLLRRIIHEVLEHLEPFDDPLAEVTHHQLVPLREAISALHFPDDPDHVVRARERLAIEEMLVLMRHSHTVRARWETQQRGYLLKNPTPIATLEKRYPLPFQLTSAQRRCVDEIVHDLHRTVPMNRLLIGDVGSGKTAVAGLAATTLIAAGHHVVLVAPTQILAEQHRATLQKLFPSLTIHLVTARQKLPEKRTAPALIVGTHAVLNHLSEIQPAMIIYDEQHRFGVAQRSLPSDLARTPHLLTLSATPIPRTLVLTLFSHLSLSVIDEMPPGRQPVKTWVVPESKRRAAYDWITQELRRHPGDQCLVVCPFIDPSVTETTATVAAASQRYAEMVKVWPTLRVGLLHGRMKKPDQAKIATQLYARELDVLVTTPIVEVGVDIPTATIMVIEAAERFGLASLHQLRGRVGRAGQAASCLLFTTSPNSSAKQRLRQFCQIHRGQELAELDLRSRGAGDLFGFSQHGFDTLKFASWANLALVTQANQIFQDLEQLQTPWQSLVLPLPSGGATEVIAAAN